MMLIKLTKAELNFVRDTLDDAREEFVTLVDELEWYVTEMDERCLAAYNILKYAEKLESTEDSNATEVE